MPYLKISRDKRGYETYYLLEPASDRSSHSPSRPRILFWFRTPPQVKVGREPFSEEIRQAIEAQHPDLKFDWPKLMAMQPPPLDVQRWRERRRLERAARRAARDESEREADTSGAPDGETNGAEELPIDDVDTPRHSIEVAVDAEAVPAVPAGPSSDLVETSPSPSRRRRRRRRGRRHGSGQADSTAPQPPPAEPPSSDEV
jgi:hypothetical protein